MNNFTILIVVCLIYQVIAGGPATTTTTTVSPPASTTTKPPKCVSCADALKKLTPLSPENCDADGARKVKINIQFLSPNRPETTGYCTMTGSESLETLPFDGSISSVGTK